jgi:hypothetical protein
MTHHRKTNTNVNKEIAAHRGPSLKHARQGVVTYRGLLRDVLYLALISSITKRGKEGWRGREREREVL